ncbi:MAG: hypothetical protein ACXIVD_04445 [Salinarimonas sp.]
MSNENGENNENLKDFMAEGARERSPENEKLSASVAALEEKLSELEEKILEIGQNSKKTNTLISINYINILIQLKLN